MPMTLPGCDLWQWADFLQARQISGPALLLSHETAENCQKDVDNRFCEDACSCSHRNSVSYTVIACFIRSVQPIYTLCSPSWMQQLVSSCGSANTTTSLRRLTLAAYSAAGNVQTVHHRPQMPTRSSSTIPARTVHTSLHQRWTSFPAFSNIWRSARAKDVDVNIRTSQFRRLRTYSVWNKLPATLRVSPTLGQFQSKLKAVLFRSAYETWLVAFVTA